MKRITAIILTLVLILAGTAALADDIHDTISAVATHTRITTTSNSVTAKYLTTDLMKGIYCLCIPDTVAIEYYDGSNVYQYYILPDSETSSQSCTFALFTLLDMLEIVPNDHIFCYVNLNSSKYAFYNPIIDDSITDGNKFNDFTEFCAYILEN